MKLFFIGFVFLSLISLANAAEPQKLEGQCSGLMADGSTISFAYYSNFDGCSSNIDGAIKFSSESRLGRYKGKRTFADSKDIYSFQKGRRVNNRKEIYRLTFADSTGNVSGVLDYKDVNGIKQSITVQCLIEEFEYRECHGQI